MPKFAHHPSDFKMIGKLYMPILVTVLAGILNFGDEFEWRCCGDGKILYVCPEKVAKLMFIQHSNTLITFTYTQIHSHTHTYSHIHSNTLKYNHNPNIHSHKQKNTHTLTYTQIQS